MIRRAFTLIELLVVIAIIAILAAILFPVFAQAKAAAKKTVALSNVKQIATANYLYANDNEDQLNRKYWDLYVDLMPYTKSIDIFTDGASGSAKPVLREFTDIWLSDMNGPNQAGPDDPPVSGKFWTNVPEGVTSAAGPWNKNPSIFGHLGRNDEILVNYGFTPRAANTTLATPSLNASTWERPSESIMYASIRGVGEDPAGDTNPYSNNNGIYFEVGGTTWNEVFAAVSVRHAEGMVMSMLDTSAKYRKAKWVYSRKGKLAICPPCADVPDDKNWANQGNGRAGFIECLNTNLD